VRRVGGGESRLRVLRVEPLPVQRERRRGRRAAAVDQRLQHALQSESFEDRLLDDDHRAADVDVGRRFGRCDGASTGAEEKETG
jgi:hypothetical protein